MGNTTSHSWPTPRDEAIGRHKEITLRGLSQSGRTLGEIKKVEEPMYKLALGMSASDIIRLIADNVNYYPQTGKFTVAEPEVTK